MNKDTPFTLALWGDDGKISIKSTQLLTRAQAFSVIDEVQGKPVPFVGEQLPDATEIAHLRAMCRRHLALVRLMGSLHDGSHTSVELWQDDATGDYHLRAGNHNNHNKHLVSLLDEAAEHLDKQDAEAING